MEFNAQITKLVKKYSGILEISSTQFYSDTQINCITHHRAHTHAVNVALSEPQDKSKIYLLQP